MFLSPDSARGEPKKVAYPGKPLEANHIRLVKLLPGQWTDPIICELTNVHLDGAQYQALSYVWGSRRVTQTVQLNGVAYPVTVNLINALRHLREQKVDGLVLWVDALCIDQENVKERTHQVELMGGIYLRCWRVIVYLGDRLQGSAQRDKAPPSLSFEHHIPPHVEPEGRDDQVRPSQRPDAFEVFCLIQELSCAEHLSDVPALGLRRNDEDLSHAQKVFNDRVHLIEALRMFMHPPFTPWWNRIWVVQEVTAPPQVQIVYGTISAPWSMFALAASNYIKHSMTCCQHFATILPGDQTKVLSDFCNRILDIDGLRTIEHSRTRTELMGDMQNNKRSLLSLMRRFRDRKASDPRDKVYALLSLVQSPRGKKGLLPDYSLSEPEVFRLATLESIYTTKSLAVFSTELGRKFRNDLPSWVPDWSAPGGYTYSLRAEAVELYNACGEISNTEKDIVPYGNSGLLVRGWFHDHVNHTSDTMWGDDAICCRDTLAKWWTYLHSDLQVLRPQLAYARSEFWRIICADAICESQPVTKVRRTTAEDELTFVLWALHSERAQFRGEVVGLSDDAWSSHARVWRDVLIIWPYKSILDASFQSKYQDHKHYAPYGFVENARYPRRMFMNLVDFVGDESLAAQLLDDSGKIQLGGPWRELHVQIRERFIQKYGPDVDLDVQKRLELVPTIDNSIMAATLSRQLIVGQKYVGLAPGNTEIHDQLYFLVGGKTPYILRNSHGGHRNSEYEVVGDCFILGEMDGHPTSIIPSPLSGIVLV